MLQQKLSQAQQDIFWWSPPQFTCEIPNPKSIMGRAIPKSEFDFFLD